MSLIDVIRYRSCWQQFLARKKWFEDEYEIASPEERERIMEKFNREIDGPLQAAWDKLSKEEKEKLHAEIFTKKEVQKI